MMNQLRDIHNRRNQDGVWPEGAFDEALLLIRAHDIREEDEDEICDIMDWADIGCEENFE